VTRDEFRDFCRQQITDEYGGVPIGIDDAVERIADKYAQEIDWYDQHVCEDHA
jgi:hypothetical protein